MELAYQRIIESGTLGTLLVIAGFFLWYVTRRFIGYLELTDERHREERERWVQELTSWRRDLQVYMEGSKENHRSLMKLAHEISAAHERDRQVQREMLEVLRSIK